MNWTRLTRLLPSLVAIGALALVLTACDGLSDFGDMNQDPTSTNNLSPGIELSTIQLGTAGSRYEVWRHNLIYTAQIAQQVVHPGGVGAGSQNGYVSSWSGAFFGANYYGGANGNNITANVKNIVNLVNRLEGQPDQVNRLAAARIWKALIFQRLTDTYGDVPYFEAAQGAIDGNFSPAYTPQEEIYEDLHRELRAAVNQFDSSRPMYGSSDLVFGGDIEQWKQFANSLQLRLAMRIKDVEPDSARIWAEEAINSGVMQGMEDEVYINHQNGPTSNSAVAYNTNAIGEVCEAFRGSCPYLSEEMVTWMKDNNDPRLPHVGAVFAVGEASDAETDPAAQKGMPAGVTTTELPDDPGTYSRINPNLTDLDDPFYLLSYAEVELMLAEAQVEWGIAPNSAEAHYEAGVEAAMKKLERYGSASFTSSEIQNYYNNSNPFPSGEEAQLEAINTQYWAATFPHGLEAWANWKVTGYPELTPPDEQGSTQGQIIRRLAYPQEEGDLNSDNYNEALNRQGITQSNRLTARMWWDAQ